MEKKKKRLGKGLEALIHTDLDDLDIKQESKGKNLIPTNSQQGNQNMTNSQVMGSQQAFPLRLRSFSFRTSKGFFL